ncbi:hypothetical protein Achl_4165 (plasmid) [Pseudarthrobacter chlorophenolicus A6]|uniref:Lipoprotein n=1 Tax=Pseudarthrobacter chlorophenolicus (strain ATCC 700700 / DSM 12829 / CIP 107037 / JCM 12360 / KCTC 9906 / NCIMB 13794 / A6) TaxID=452863 RepID=B8HI69_PSECP|nr:hypothetical protein [Pseudarthrobacter chlorophenolicus]ACL42116.1 hypothetical protein Achl_4165 [Pseudarthrobacter chlorophenolicus A6]SDQ13636.1 hypothetical protein SAMN04489738_0224 [Pseudarthrobacter chlorophenolicus]
MNSITKGFGVLVLTAAVAFGASGCSQKTPDAAPSPTVDAKELTGGKAAEAIKGFVAAGTSDEVAAAVASQATADTFAPAVKFLDKDAASETVQNTVSEFVLVKMADPKAAVSVDVDESRVVVDGQKATVPVEAVTVSAGGKKVANSDALADSVNDLVFRDGAWVITFPAAASASPSATPSESAK